MTDSPLSYKHSGIAQPASNPHQLPTCQAHEDACLNEQRLQSLKTRPIHPKSVLRPPQRASLSTTRPRTSKPFTKNQDSILDKLGPCYSTALQNRRIPHYYTSLTGISCFTFHGAEHQPVPLTSQRNNPLAS